MLHGGAINLQHVVVVCTHHIILHKVWVSSTATCPEIAYFRTVCTVCAKHVPDHTAPPLWMVATFALGVPQP